ncbi:hypothetical protein HY630_00300 [Candidatus Uhrbacteria bacterium]|nr:hypothetical protein [Candidatus Uhrbacteria bacterium]
MDGLRLGSAELLETEVSVPRRDSSCWEDFKLFWSVFGPSPGFITGVILFELIFWSSPQWAQDIGFPTDEGQRIAHLEHCEDLVDREAVARMVVVHDHSPIPATELADWTPQRVEAVYDSGLTVVSTLTPHGNIQTVVRDLTLPVGTTFRLLDGRVVDIS